RNRVNEYQKRIDNLNESLKEIEYTSETYIQLTYVRTKDQQIRAFEVELANCFPNVNRDGDRANEVAYLRIRDLLNRLDEETYWARKVTDVRNWLDFAADERRKSDDSQQERYEGASGKSGGQKAKLAYTIMASAIAYQYGIFEHNRKDSKTFRFVVVDEVFSKSDESNSRFAMDLFRELGLQVLVVTPSDKIHIVEPYIGICHWVKNNDEGNNSRVMDITIEQLREQRAQIGAAD
ncbi:MAG: SbcC/MukB-like Walker B domain-containing protein, partial [Chloroflexota bacterium]